MFGKRKLYTEGVQVEGQVYALTGYGNNGGGQDYGIRVRVRLPDGSVRELEKGPLGARGIHGIGVGSVVPVRYDPNDLDKVAIDLPALQAQSAQAKSGTQSLLDAQFAHLGEPGAAGEAGAAGAAGPVVLTGLQGIAGIPGLAAALGAAGAHATPDGGAPTDPADRLAKFAALRDRGIISEDEFAAQKARLLAEG